MPDAARPITIVSGLPRSGTSMMMRMLEAGGISALTDKIRAADEDNPRGYYEFEPVKRTRQDSSWLSQAQGKAVKLVHLLLYDLPPGRAYRVLLMQRRMEEVLASQRTMLERQGRAGAALRPEQLARVYQDQLDKLDAWLAARPDFRVLKVDYNRMLADPAPVAREINAFLDGALDEAAMIRVVEPALYRQRR